MLRVLVAGLAGALLGTSAWTQAPVTLEPVVVTPGRIRLVF